MESVDEVVERGLDSGVLCVELLELFALLELLVASLWGVLCTGDGVDGLDA